MDVYPDQVRGRLSLKNALTGSDDDPGDASGGNALTGRWKRPRMRIAARFKKPATGFPARA